MKYVYALGKLAVFALIALTFVTHVLAQEDPVAAAASKLSGKVVDTEGKPVSGFTFIVQSIQLINGFPQPGAMLPHLFHKQPGDENQPGAPKPFAFVKTADDGTFKTTDIQSGFVQIDAMSGDRLDAIKKFDPKNPDQHPLPMEMMQFGRIQSEMQILSIQLNKVTFFSIKDGPGPFRGLRFGLKPGTNIEDVKITVKKLLKIRAQIVYADGTPLANAKASLSMRYRGGEFGGDSGTHGTNCLTDAEGYFTEYREAPGFYTLSITYKTFNGGAGPFLLKDDETPKNIVIKLDGNPVVAKQPNGDTEKVNKGKARQLINKIFAGNNRQQPIRQKQEKIVWIINPENGHAYAQIPCGNWYDAQRRAIEEEAHLLSINDEDEQIWVQIMFRHPHFWIGLNDVEEEGVWRWDSGEPVTFTNWTPHEMFGDDSPDAEKDFVAVTFFEGGWQAASPKSPMWQIVHMAVIEKDGLISKIPEPAEVDEDE